MGHSLFRAYHTNGAWELSHPPVYLMKRLSVSLLKRLNQPKYAAFKLWILYFYIFWSFRTMWFNIEVETVSLARDLGAFEMISHVQYLSWTDSISIQLHVQHFYISAFPNEFFKPSKSIIAETGRFYMSNVHDESMIIRCPTRPTQQAYRRWCTTLLRKQKQKRNTSMDK